MRLDLTHRKRARMHTTFSGEPSLLALAFVVPNGSRLFTETAVSVVVYIMYSMSV